MELYKIIKQTKEKTYTSNLSRRPGTHCFNLSLGFSPSSLKNMNFSTPSSFSTNYQTLGSVQYNPATGPAGQQLNPMSMQVPGASAPRSLCPTPLVWGWLGVRGLARGMTRGLAGIIGNI